VGDFSNHGARAHGRIDAQLFPPCLFITTPVSLSMIAATLGHCELVADPAAKRDSGRIW
jgi:hypothetical protein